jgi:hypothetical protein
MKSQNEFLLEMISALERAGVRCMITGSLASTYHGRPRTTQNIDVVIEAEAAGLMAFVEYVRGVGYYVDPQSAEEALSNHSIFNIIDPMSGDKFTRREKVFLHGSPVFMASAEDSILSKLEWAKESGSDRQFLDALGVFLVSQASLDLAYLSQWATVLGVSSELERLLSKARGSAQA